MSGLKITLGPYDKAGTLDFSRKMLEAKNGRIFSFDPILFIQLQLQKGHTPPFLLETDYRFLKERE